MDTAILTFALVTMKGVSADNAAKRDYCCAWLGLLLVEYYEVESHAPSRVEVVTSECTSLLLTYVLCTTNI